MIKFAHWKALFWLSACFVLFAMTLFAQEPGSPPVTVRPDEGQPASAAGLADAVQPVGPSPAAAPGLPRPGDLTGAIHPLAVPADPNVSPASLAQAGTGFLPGLASASPQASGLVGPQVSGTGTPAGTKKTGWWEGLAIIIYADAVMSVENVLIIAILVSEIPARIRMVAVFFGLLAAGLFRVLFASMATILMKYPVVALLGAITLVFLAVSLFTDTIKQLRKKPEAHPPEEKIDWAVVREELHRMFREKGFWSSAEGEALKTVMVTVILQDILLSLDNVLVVAGTAHGDLGLTIIGVLISIVMMGTIANLMVTLVKKYPVLGFIGGLALSKAAYNLYMESYSHEAAVVAFGSIVVFVMFGRVYHKLTSEEDEVKPLTISLEEKPEEAGFFEPEEELVPAPAFAKSGIGATLPEEGVLELLNYLKKNEEVLHRVEALLEEKNGG